MNKGLSSHGQAPLIERFKYGDEEALEEGEGAMKICCVPPRYQRTLPARAKGIRKSHPQVSPARLDQPVRLPLPRRVT